MDWLTEGILYIDAKHGYVEIFESVHSIGRATHVQEESECVSHANELAGWNCSTSANTASDGTKRFASMLVLMAF